MELQKITLDEAKKYAEGQFLALWNRGDSVRWIVLSHDNQTKDFYGAGGDIMRKELIVELYVLPL